MSKATITEGLLTNIANAIRAKNGSSDTYTPAQMATAIANIPNTYAAGDEGKVVSNGALVAQTAHATVTENGTIDTTLNNSVTVNVSGGGSSGELPSTYQQVEYLEFTGAEYIAETGINLIAGDAVFGFAALDSSVSSSTEDGVIGGNAQDTFEVYYYQGKLQYYGNIGGLTDSGNTGQKKIIAGTISANASNLAIGRYHQTYVHKGKIWDVFVYRIGSNPLYRHYVPCYRKSDNVAGYYEVIRGAFYTNQGTGTIGVGPDVT